MAYGGSMSEPGTLVDLSENLRLAHDNQEKLKEYGWDFGNRPIHQVVAGCMHVDDSVIFSKVMCKHCIIQGMRKLWPTDVGLELEEEGPMVRFLHSIISIHAQRIYVFPHNPNISFAFDIECVRR